MSDYAIGDWRKLGAVLRDMRRQRGVTQTQLANEAGVSRAWLAKLEAGGHRRAEMEQVLRLLSALNVEMFLRDRRSRAGAAQEPSPLDVEARIPSPGSVPPRAENEALRRRAREADERIRDARAALADARKAREVRQEST